MKREKINFERTDFSSVRAILRKHRQEQFSSFRRGGVNVTGNIFRLAIGVVLIAVFVIFFGRFTGIYAGVYTNGAPDKQGRVYELLTLSFSVLLLFMTVEGISLINRELFAADDIRLFSAMPISAGTLYTAKLIIIYVRQTALFLPFILAVTVTIAAYVIQPWWYFVAAAGMCLLLPLLALALSSLIAIPYFAVKEFLKEHFALNFLAVTVLLAGGFTLYAFVLNAVKELLLGRELRYFFNEPFMRGIGRAVACLVPSNWLAGLMVGRNAVVGGLAVAGVIVLSVLLSLIMLRIILKRVLSARTTVSRAVGNRRTAKKGSSVFTALVKKEFIQIFRTPAYMFSYFSVAIVMPLMVYFCMSIASSLIVRVAGLSCDTELALFLTLMFGALSNVFCSTNISREGKMFFSMKAMPVDYKTIFFAKIFFCMLVSVLSQLVTAIMLAAAGYLSWYFALFLFVVGTLFSFVYIALATRSDFNHARFSEEEDGEIAESGTTASVTIFINLLLSFAVGGSVLFVRIMSLLRGAELGYLTYLLPAAIAIPAAAFACFYLLHGLGKKYYEFERDT